jgi:UDP-galactopyranose mutase
MTPTPNSQLPTPTISTSEKVLIVGAGFSGAVVARELAEAGISSQVIDQRPHIAGNCHTERDQETGVMLHQYGPHIFNTDKEDVWTYINRFADFGPFVNRVKAMTSRGVFSLPVNLHTLNQFFGKTLSPTEAKAYLAEQGDSSIGEPANFEEAALKHLGRDLYETFFKGYTLKQWETDPKDLPASVFARLPIRFNYDDNYYAVPYQGIPREGYSAIVAAILDHDRIKVDLNTSFTHDRMNEFKKTVFTGPIDAFYGHLEGRLGYRTVYWDRETLEGDAQGNPLMNYPELAIPWTRKIEHKHFAPWEEHAKTVLFTEYSKETGPEDVPYYPKRLAHDKAILARYQAMAEKEERVHFLGRLGRYQYLDMDDTIAAALGFAGELIGKLGN